MLDHNRQVITSGPKGLSSADYRGSFSDVLCYFQGVLMGVTAIQNQKVYC